MQVSDYIRAKQVISHPKWLSCGLPMLLASIEPDEPDHDKRTFECQACLKTITKVVKYK